MYQRTTAILFFLLLLFIPLLTSPQTNPPSWGILTPNIAEFQPNIANGGRANTIAVHPEQTKILVTSESGGLFRSTDGGKTWKHIDTLPVYFTNAVAFVPSNPDIVIATASEDFSVSNRGGIWRSANGGDTWDPVIWKNPSSANPFVSPSPPGITGRFSAFEISIAPDTGKIYVASSNGLEIGEPDGKSWKHQDLSIAVPQLISVLALPKKTPGGNNVLLAGGPSGLYLSTNEGKHWSAPTTTPGCDSTNQVYPFGCIVDMHAFGNSPVAKKHAYVVNGNKQLYYTEDYGNTWTQIKNTPAGAAGCGGISFIQVKPGDQTNNIDLYFGNRCTLSKLTASPASGGTFNYAGAFTDLKSDHGDTRHIAFNNKNKPLLLATDGGLHSTSDGGANWTFIGGGKNGFNALQIFHTNGQWIDDVAKHNLYFGTQDNALWSSGDGGKTWSPCCNEGGTFEMDPHVATENDSQITFFTHIENQKLSGLLYSTGAVQAWLNPSADDDSFAGRPKFVKKNFHVQGVEQKTVTIGPVPVLLFSRGLAVTYDFAKPGTWKKFAAINEDRRDIPESSLTSQKDAVLYQAIRTGMDATTNLETHGLARIKKDGSVTYPAMKNFGGFGIASTMDSWYYVFAVDPGNVNHLIAADVIHQQMMETFNGGDEWKEMQQLTSLVTNGGQLNFRGRIFFSQFPPMWYPDLTPITQVSAIAFCPDNNMIAVGTVQNGVFLSDGGKKWKKVSGSERATLISSIHWRKSDDIIVSTYGRGLWRIGFKYVTSVVAFPQ